MVHELVQSVIIQGTAAHFRGVMQRFKILCGDTWTASSGEVLEFEEERLTESVSSFSEFGMSRSIDRTPSNRTSWLIKSQKPITEEERQSKIGAIRKRFARDFNPEPEKHTQPWKTAGIEAWELPGNRTQIDFIDTYAPYRRNVAGEALWLPIGPAFMEFSEEILSTPEIIQIQETPEWLTKRASDEIQMRIPEIVQAIQAWTPKQLFKKEEAYVAALGEYLGGRGIEAPEQQGMSLTDILARCLSDLSMNTRCNIGS